MGNLLIINKHFFALISYGYLLRSEPRAAASAAAKIILGTDKRINCIDIFSVLLNSTDKLLDLGLFQFCFLFYFFLRHLCEKSKPR